ncbi:DUF1080 domain-containing protein [Sphingobacterium sp. SGG-5]|nr:DUF1080 domain-containing protein [Sphingobacterium sp. SGG-5]
MEIRFLQLMWILLGIYVVPSQIFAQQIAGNVGQEVQWGEWEHLLDGGDPNVHWRSKNSDSFPKDGWAMKDGLLLSLPGKKAGDIITREQFSDFDLVFEFNLTDSANTGVKYFVAPLLDKKGKTTLNGPEYQLIDDINHPSVRGGKSPKTITGALYLLYAPQKSVFLPVGQWNTGRIIAYGTHVEHWLNGVKVLEYERGSEDYRRRIAGTKFKGYVTPYGEAKEGHILLQYHNDKAFFRNVKIRKVK